MKQSTQQTITQIQKEDKRLMSNTHELLLELCSALGYEVDTVKNEATKEGVCKRDAYALTKSGEGWDYYEFNEESETFTLKMDIGESYKLKPNVNTMIARTRAILPKGYKLTVEKINTNSST